MSMQNLFKSLISTSKRRRPIRRNPAAYRPRLEALEARCVLSTGLSFADPVLFDSGALPPSDPRNVVNPASLRLPLAIAVEDFDQDGDADVATADPYGG